MNGVMRKCERCYVDMVEGYAIFPFQSDNVRYILGYYPTKNPEMAKCLKCPESGFSKTIETIENSHL
jgi:hypothetical protein